MSVTFRDLRFALRMARQSPGFSALIILLLGLGIGATTAVYSVVSSMLIRPLPYVDSDQIVKIWETDPPMMHGTVSAPNFLDWKKQNTVFESMAAISFGQLNLTGDHDSERLDALHVSLDFFPLLGVRPELGRSFANEETKVGGDDVVILSHDFWQRRYGSNPSIIGRAINLSGRSYTVVGIMPKGFRSVPSFREPEVWLPLVFDTQQLERRDSHYLFVLARLMENHTVAAARNEMDAIARSLAQLYPDTNGTRGVGLELLREFVIRDVRPSLLVLLGAVVLVLLIACANIACLLLVRSTTRQSEVAIRLALGASRTALVRQFLVESALLSIIGGAAGLLLALWMTDLIVAGMPGGLMRIIEPGVDENAVAFAVGLSFLTSFAFGLVPAIHSADGGVPAALREAGTRASASRRSSRTRNTLVVAEIALSLALAAGATLLIQSYVNLRQTDLGFDPKHVVTADISLPMPAGDPELAADKVRSFFDQLIARVEALPGVESVGIVNNLPLKSWGVNGPFTIEGTPRTGPGRPVTEHLTVNPEFFETMGMPLRAGRLFTRADNSTSQPVAIVNETMASFWPDKNPFGKRMKPEGAPDWMWLEVVGVVANVHRQGARSAPVPETYMPFAQAPALDVSIVVRGHGEPLRLVPSIRREIAALDSTQAMGNVRTMEDLVERSIAHERFVTILLGLFAATALLLALVGVYGTISYQVSQRTHEIGVRMALGARETDIWKLVVGTGAKLTALGIVVGVIATLASSKLIGSLLFGVGATDPVTYAAVTALMAGVALLASYFPARRAARIRPMSALRIE